MSFFGFSKKDAAIPWPRGEDGGPEPAALLCRTEARGFETEIIAGMLRSFGVPAITKTSGDGFIGELYTGAPSFGVDIFVPRSRLNDARALLEADEYTDEYTGEYTENVPPDGGAAAEYFAEYERWLASPALSESELRELRDIAADSREIESRFSGGLQFGTAGLRGVMALGTNRMNIYTVRLATQAFAEIILERLGGDNEVAVCRDCRVNSRKFAEEASSVLAGNGLRVRIFDDMRPTPELSFAIRRYGCAAGINITASHNTKEYNGCKVYWTDGAQLPPDAARAVAERMEKLDVFDSIKRADYADAAARDLVTVMGRETDELFLESVLAEARRCGADTDMNAPGRELRIAYTPFHGAGRVLVPEALARLGYKNVFTVNAQMTPDGDFPTVSSPNPENPESFALALNTAESARADIIIGTDPDCDRVAVLARREGGFAHMSGHKTGVLLLNFIAGGLRRAGAMPDKPVALKSIVTTDMARRAAEVHGVRCIDTFTGFKFMAEMKNKLEAEGSGSVIFSYEESYGYMAGDFVRDKDAVTASALIAEMSAWYSSRGMTLFGALDELYEKLGYYDEAAVSLVMPGADGARETLSLMSSLREYPPDKLSGARVVSRRDYLAGAEYKDGNETALALSGSDVLRFDTEDGAAVLIRPSGTEPKVKIYVLARGATLRECAEMKETYAAWARSLRAPPE
ncbi:MAG: phospho-sugar mutase [Oscillospiraceae bacterium]|jgi:phosphoglucomutase|nr:phospho-sugar mutase [Oscillospiraceae bacterium]